MHININLMKTLTNSRLFKANLGNASTFKVFEAPYESCIQYNHFVALYLPVIVIIIIVTIPIGGLQSECGAVRSTLRPSSVRKEDVTLMQTQRNDGEISESRQNGTETIAGVQLTQRSAKQNI